MSVTKSEMELLSLILSVLKYLSFFKNKLVDDISNYHLNARRANLNHAYILVGTTGTGQAKVEVRT
jgi:hypothetical protein